MICRVCRVCRVLSRLLRDEKNSYKCILMHHQIGMGEKRYGDELATHSANPAYPATHACRIEAIMSVGTDPSSTREPSEEHPMFKKVTVGDSVFMEFGNGL